MTENEDSREEERALNKFIPPETDEVAEAAPPVEHRATPRTSAAAVFDRSKGAAFLVASGILLSRVAGLIRQTMMARYLGAGMAADAFNAAFRIPNLLQNLFGEGVLSASFIPEYAGLLGQREEKEATKLAASTAAVQACSPPMLSRPSLPRFVN